MRLVLATKNPGKVIEFERILAEFGAKDLEVVGLDKFPQIGDIEETGKTFEENALLKARTICKLTGLPALADDSGICVDALNGAPGLYSARYSGNGDAANNEKLLNDFVLISSIYLQTTRIQRMCSKTLSSILHVLH